MALSVTVVVSVILVVCLIIFVWIAAHVYIQHRRMKLICVSVGRCLVSLRRISGAEYEADLCARDKASFAAVRCAFRSYIRSQIKYRDGLLGALNAICGTSYTVMDMYDCFDNGRLNSFFHDISGRSGYLFINMLYLAQLEKNGFQPVDMSPINRYM